MNHRRRPTSASIPSDLAVFRLPDDPSQTPTLSNFAPGSRGILMLRRHVIWGMYDNWASFRKSLHVWLRRAADVQTTGKEKVMRTLAQQLVERLFNAFGPQIRRRRVALKPMEVLLAPLDPHFRSALLSMYRGESQLGADGQMHPIDQTTKICPSQGMWIYDLCLSVKPKSTLEIGMAYGYSTLYFLAAITRNQAGHHTAIDPFQLSF